MKKKEITAIFIITITYFFSQLEFFSTKFNEIGIEPITIPSLKGTFLSLSRKNVY